MSATSVRRLLPVATWPGARPEPDTTALAGTAWISAYHWLGVLLLSRSSCSVCEPPSESETGIGMVKSG